MLSWTRIRVLKMIHRQTANFASNLIFQGYFGPPKAKWPIPNPIPNENMRFEALLICWRWWSGQHKLSILVSWNKNLSTWQGERHTHGVDDPINVRHAGDSPKCEPHAGEDDPGWTILTWENFIQVSTIITWENSMPVLRSYWTNLLWCTGFVSKIPHLLAS